jgi:fructoselysine-6-P-deglycase FrlB-like protein
MMLLLAMARTISEEELQELVASVRKVIASMDPIPGLEGLPPGRVVCAGFAAEWIADEIALKFAEMAGLSVTSEPLIEYFHGPVGAAAPTLAFLDLEDPNAHELIAAEQVVTVGADSSFAVVIPTTSDPALDAIVRLVAGQRMALAWAKHLGQDADADRGLKKVTPTR